MEREGIRGAKIKTDRVWDEVGENSKKATCQKNRNASGKMLAGFPDSMTRSRG